MTSTGSAIYVLYDLAGRRASREGHMRMSVMLLVLAVAAPALAQSPVYGNADLGKPIAASIPIPITG